MNSRFIHDFKTKRDILYPLILRLIILSFIVLVAIIIVKRTFFAMKIVKSRVM